MAAVVKRSNDDNIKGVGQVTSSDRILGNFKNSPGAKKIKVGEVNTHSKDIDEVMKDLRKIIGEKRRSSKKARKSRIRKSSRRKRRSKKRR